MKKLIALLMALTLLAVSAVSLAETEDLLDRVLAAGKLVVGTEGTYPPNTYYDEDGNLVGFDVEVAQAIAAKLGVEYEPFVSDWASIISAMDTGRIDTVINEVEINEERLLKYDFSVPYTYIHGAVLVAADNEDIKTLDDLKGKRAAQNASSMWGIRAEEYGATIVPVTSDPQTYDLITTGRADFTLNAETAFADYMDKHPETPVKVALKTEGASSSVVPCLKGNTKFTEAVSKAIEELREEGVLAELSMKYFKGDFTNE